MKTRETANNHGSACHAKGGSVETTPFVTVMEAMKW